MKFKQDLPATSAGELGRAILTRKDESWLRPVTPTGGNEDSSENERGGKLRITLTATPSTEHDTVQGMPTQKKKYLQIINN